MPLTLEELLDLAGQSQRKAFGSGFLRTGTTAVTDPLGVLKGVGRGLTGMIKNVGSSLANIAQATTGEEIYYASENVPEGAFERTGAVVGNLANLVTFGFSDAWTSNTLKAAANRELLEGQRNYGKPLTGDDILTTLASGFAGAVKDVILPVAEIGAAARGDMTAEEIGEAAFSGVGKLGLLAGIASRGPKFGTPAAETRPRRFLTSGDIAAEKARMVGLETKTAATRVASTEVTPTPQGARPSRAVAPTVTQTGPLRLSSEEVASLTQEAASSVAFTEIGNRILSKKNLEEARPFLAVAETIRVAGQDSTIVRELAETYNIPLESAAKAFGDSLEFIVSEAGKTEQVMSNLVKTLELRAFAGNESALSAMKILEKMSKTTAQLTGLKASLAKIEKARKISATMQPVTAVRNFEVGLVNSASQLFGDLVTGVVEASVSKLKGESLPLNAYFIDFAHSWGALISRLNPKERGLISDIIHQMPVEEARFKLTNLNVDANVLTNSALTEAAISKTSPGLGKRVGRAIFGGLNRLNEVEQGKFFFQSRLGANMERLGYTLPQVLEKLKRPTEFVLDENGKASGRTPAQLAFDSAIQDAFTFAEKQGFRYNPQLTAGGFEGLGAQYLKFTRNNPWMTIVGPLFPRFLINQYLWLTERSPLNWFDLFNPAFRTELTKGLNGGLRSAAAARTLGRATEGLMNMSAAWAVRQSPVAGPKYYELQATNNANEKNIMDLRAFQPFRSYLFLAEYFQASAEGRSMNVTPAEATDELLNIRRLSDVLILNIPDILRAMNSENPDAITELIAKPAGQYAAAFVIPARLAQEVAGGVGSELGVEDAEELLKARDVSGQPWTGPSVGGIPGISGNLPARVDPFTGSPTTSEHPLIRQMFGASINKQTRLEQMVRATPKVQVGDLVGDFGNQRANQMVTQRMGTLLTSQIGGRPIGDIIADKIENNFPNLAMRKQVVQEVFEEIRALARESAEAEDPEAFLDHYINTSQEIPPGLKDEVRSLIRKSRIKP